MHLPWISERKQGTQYSSPASQFGLIDALPGSVRQLISACVLSCIVFLLVAVPPSALAQVWCADSVHYLMHFVGPDTGSHAGTQLAGLGDINGDGWPDLAVGNYNPVRTFILFGGPGADAVPDLRLPARYGPPVGIDANGDGYRDVVASEFLPGAIYDSTLATLYLFAGHGDSVDSIASDSLTLFSGNFAFGTRFDVAFVDDDSLPDFLIRNQWSDSKRDTQPQVYYYSGPFGTDKTPDWSFAWEPFKWFLFDLGFMDWNGDNVPDIVLGLYADTTTSGYVYIFFGPDFKPAPDIVIGPPDEDFHKDWFAEYLSVIGDYDGDGYDDLAVSVGSRWFIYTGGPASDTVYDYQLNRNGSPVVGIGDINKDGYADVALGQTRAEFGGVDVYLGGPRADGFSDYCLDGQVLPLDFLDRMGYRICPTGDWDGDGVDDFAFACENDFGWEYGAVLIVPGNPDIHTDVAEDREWQATGESRIRSVYPSPANLAVTIAYTVARTGPTTVEIVNLLGARVSTLYSGRQSAGDHLLRWDGLIAEKAAASGVYFVCLTVDNTTMTRKFLILK